MQWLPAPGTPPAQGHYAHQGLLLGTHAPAGAPNALLVADVRLPLRQRDAAPTPPEADVAEADAADAAAPCTDGAAPFLRVVERVPLPAPVCRARHMPQNARLVAVALLGAGVALVRTAAAPEGAEDAVTRLGGYEGGAGTFALAWAPQRAGTLLAGGLDGALCVWDAAHDATPAAQPQPRARAPGAPVCDACFHPRLADVAGVVRGGRALLWDTRTPAPPDDSGSSSSGGGTVLGEGAEGSAATTCMSLSAGEEVRAATGDEAGGVLVWDVRHAAAPVQRLCAHGGAVLQVAWSEGLGGVLASTAADRRVLVWDTARAGRPQTPAERAEGPPELLFVHGGHTALVTDLAWNPHDPLTVASVAHDNILQVWQPASVL